MYAPPAGSAHYPLVGGIIRVRSGGKADARVGRVKHRVEALTVYRMRTRMSNTHNAKRRKEKKDSQERKAHNELEREGVTKRADDEVDTIRFAPDLRVERAGPDLGVCIERICVVANEEI